MSSSATLEYQEVPYAAARWPVSATYRSTPFAKEPELTARIVRRGVLRLGTQGSYSVPYLWLPDAGKLYLDLNRNEDLTDDADGVFSLADKSAYQTFKNIRLPFPSGKGERRLLVDISFYSRASNPYCTVALRSYWAGKVTLHGQEWQVGLVEDLANNPGRVIGSRFLMRPWSEREEPFSNDAGSMATFGFAKKLFIGGHAYELDWPEASLSNVAQWNLRFHEQQPALGELRLPGAHIRRFTLESGTYRVVLDRPESAVKVPAGRYTQGRVWLKQGEAEACRDSGGVSPTRWLEIDAGKSRALLVGGPLTNSVTVRPRGHYLELSYRLVGAGGEPYRLLREDRSHPPQFMVFKGGEKIASGQFQYG